MPQVRKDPVVDGWVIVSTERAARPVQYRTGDDACSDEACPFCEGNETMTPPEIMAYRNAGSAPDAPGWDVRIVPNKFPAVIANQDPTPRYEGFYLSMNAVGSHEVIIESPKHETHMTALNEEQLGRVLHAYRDCLVRLKADKRFRYVLIFKNQGWEAGATMAHVHSQLLALPVVPQAALEELTGAGRFFESHRRCVYCDIVNYEARQKTRIVIEDPNFLVICPFASRVAFETWILPKTHSPSFEDASEAECLDLARCLRDTLMRISNSLDHPAFNYLIHSMPFNDSSVDYFHWHIEILPRVTRVGGFEWGSGSYMNSFAPEQSAAHLRSGHPVK